MRTALWAAMAAVALICGLAIGGAVACDKDGQSSPQAVLGCEPTDAVLSQQVHYLFQDAEAKSVERSPSRRTTADDEGGDPRPHYDIRFRFIYDPDGDWLIERDVRPIPGGRPEPKVYTGGFWLATDR